MSDLARTPIAHNARQAAGPATRGLLQRQCACGNHTVAGGECAACAKKKNGLQRKLAIGASNDPLEREADRVADQVMAASAHPVVGGAPPRIQRSARQATEGTGTAPASVDRVLAGAGRPLEPALRQDMEQRFGHDFSRVRVHAGAAAEQSAREVNANAYTVGHAVVFGAGGFAPGTQEGRRLIAHELTHVVQQADHLGPVQMLRRNACAHDQPQGSGCGRIVGTDASGDETEFPADRLIAESMRSKFPSGSWIAQVYTPPNLAKGGKAFGKMDAVKVTEGNDLTLEVVEIKSRNNGMGTGGCALATTETLGYIAALNPLTPRMAAISQGLQKIGGLSLPDCRSINAETKKKLGDAGINTDDKTDMDAWCVLNSIQNRLGRKITKGFASVTVKANKDGTAGTDYTAVAFPIRCRGDKSGLFRMVFQVNQKGGVSYRCEKACSEKRRKELEKELEKDMSKEVEIQTQAEKKKYTFDEPIGDEDPSEDSRVEVGDEGIDTTDLAIWSTGAVAATAALHIAMSKAKTKAEQELIRRTTEKLTQELARRGAPEVAKMLDSKNLSKLGTKAYQEALEKAEQAAQKRILAAGEKRLAKKLAEKGLKKGAKTAAKKLVEKGAKAIPYIGAIIVAVELLGAADAYAKGAEIQFGLEGGDADLAGDTNVEVKGDKPKGGATTDANLKDTKIDVELAKAPDTSGSIEIEAKKVSIRGKIGADNTPVLVDMKLKLENTTIIYKNTGRFKGGKVVLDGSLNIQDSTIEIDLPKDAVIETSDAMATREIKGAKIKITKVGSGPGAGKGEGQAEVAAGEKSKDVEKKEPLSAEEVKLIEAIRKDEKLKKIYDAIFGAKGLKVDKATLDRFLALKAKLEAHPELVDVIIKNSTKGDVTDPIKQVIEPMERIIADAEKQSEPKKDAAPPADATSPSDPKKDEKQKEPEKAAAAETATASGPTDAEKAKATPLAFWSLFDKGEAKPTRVGVDDSSTPTPTAAVPIRLAAMNRTYKLALRGTLESQVTPPDSKLLWEGWYLFKPPAGLVKSEQGDMAIYFTDAATKRKLKYGAFKSKKPAAAKKK